MQTKKKRKEVWLHPFIVEALERQAKEAGVSLKRYMERTLIDKVIDNTK